MNDPSAMPPVSGIDPQILAEHRRIRDLTRQLKETSELRVLLTRLAEFRAVLVAHFLGEEATDGLYDTIRSMSPRLLGRVDQLEKEHQAILVAVDALAERARACLAGPVADVLGEARALARRVSNHETAEDNVLLDTVYTDLGQGD